MENCNIHWEQRSLVNELAQGRELARQLQIHLNAPSSPHGTRELLVQKIILSYEKALSILNSIGSPSGCEQQQPTGHVAIRMVESPPHSLNGSPWSEDSDREFKDHDNKDSSGKRKTLPRWTQQIRVTSGMGLEGPLDDGFSWRKYGQKDILGARYPRGYYRCTHRNVQDCFATKQVQRSNEDPSIFEITYRGRHTCTQASPGTSTPPSPSPLPPERTEPQNNPVESQQNQQHSQQNMLLNLPEGLRVISEGLDISEELFPSFNNPSPLNNNYLGSFSPPFAGPTTSGTNYFSMSQQGFGAEQNIQSGDIISPATSAANSPSVGLDFPFGQDDQLFPNFSFDGPGFFS
ncbi:WRKY transcription factor 53 [Pyrus ussuriensis x Pyrus communis]|uniref:WRKY transcription factor 53 n=1 Tax=Pyrus ussuriensis x Pyrus communis TaxID=2448454 RepID=A0A5N5F214_9ROSA|nr:WRKY transcription factor 53 [Pyrus ussuriensis x Pyrus communis]